MADSTYSVTVPAYAANVILRMTADLVRELHVIGGTDDYEFWFHDRFWQMFEHYQSQNFLIDAAKFGTYPYRGIHNAIARESYTVHDLVHHYSRMSPGVIQCMVFKGNSFEMCLGRRCSELCDRESARVNHGVPQHSGAARTAG